MAITKIYKPYRVNGGGIFPDWSAGTSIPVPYGSTFTALQDCFFTVSGTTVDRGGNMGIHVNDVQITHYWTWSDDWVAVDLQTYLKAGDRVYFGVGWEGAPIAKWFPLRS